MEKVIVTGANGFIGSNFVKLLLSKGITVYGVDISAPTQNQFVGNYIPVICDFSHYDQLHEMINDSGIDCFYHFAWQGGFLQDSLKNYELQLNNAMAACKAICEAVKIKCKRFVYAGTVNEIEINQFINTPDFKARGTCIYATSKLAGELICKTIAQEQKIEFCAGYIPMIYGIGNKSKQLINIVLSSLINGESPKLIEGNNQYDLVHIDDVVRGMYFIGEAGKNMKSYYIGHKELKTFKEIFSHIGKLINPDIRLGFGEYRDPLNLDYSLIDLSELNRDTNFECVVDFDSSIIQTAEWLKSERNHI